MSLRMMEAYLQDPFLSRLYSEIRAAGALRSISVDLTHSCNLRCTGCYFFAEGMDSHPMPSGGEVLDRFIAQEKARGTNFVTVVGGEPGLFLDRLKKLYDAFSISVATNGWLRIPHEGFENLPIGIAVWGDHGTDRRLRGAGHLDVFARALANYKDDPRAFWYYTTIPGNAHEIEGVVSQCVRNGNRVLFNYYNDLSSRGTEPGGRWGFEAVRREIDRMIRLYPEHILLSSYVNRVFSSGRLYDQTWGYDVCTSLSADTGLTPESAHNGNPYNPHFRAYNADLKTTRRCCTRLHGDCSSCYDVWQHFSWIILNLRKHLGSRQEFTNWLTTMYMFYFINRLVGHERGLLTEIHARTGADLSEVKNDGRRPDLIPVEAC